MAVRCMKCGGTVEGFAQMCDGCTTVKKQGDEVTLARAVEATTMPCPTCETDIPRATQVCPHCNHDFVTIRRRPAIDHAGAMVRFFAYVLDGVFVVIPSLLVLLFVPTVEAAVAAQGVISIFYTIGFWAAQGATPGKMLLGLKVVTQDGSRISIAQAFLRYVGYWLNTFTGGIGWLFILVTDGHRGLHDFVAGTIVVHANNLPESIAAEQAKQQAQQLTG